jgi:hypothetical protein
MVSTYPRGGACDQVVKHVRIEKSLGRGLITSQFIRQEREVESPASNMAMYGF